MKNLSDKIYVKTYYMYSTVFLNWNLYMKDLLGFVKRYMHNLDFRVIWILYLHLVRGLENASEKNSISRQSQVCMFVYKFHWICFLFISMFHRCTYMYFNKIVIFMIFSSQNVKVVFPTLETCSSFVTT